MPSDEDLFSLHGRIALVTGSARGLGFAIAHALAGAGAEVLVNGRGVDALRGAVGTIRDAGGKARELAFDVTDPEAVHDAFSRLDRLDILVNNVALRDRRGLFEFDLDSLRRLVNANLVAPFDLARRAAEKMCRHGYGRIINITSSAGPLGSVGDTPYTASKGGLEALTRALAVELGIHGITVNAVAPGYFATEANAEIACDNTVGEWLSKRTSIGRWGSPHEIAGPVVFLASPGASYVTGHVLAVDGGYLAHL